MATTLTAMSGVTPLTVTPLLVDGFSSAREAQSIVHPIIGSSEPEVTMRAGGTRTGTLQLVFADEAASRDAEEYLGVGASGVALPWTLDDDDRPSIGMTFVVAGGQVVRDLDPETRDRWIVAVPYVEVSP